MTGYTAITKKRLRAESGSLSYKLATEYGLLETLLDGIDKTATVMTLAEDSIVLDGTISVAAGHTLALPSGTTVNEFSIDGTFTGNSDDALPTEKAVKTYVDAQILTKDTFLELTDTPSTYTANGAIYIADNSNSEVDESTVILAEGTNTFSITKGTASLDIAAAATLDVDANLTVSAACTLDQDLQQTSTPTFATAVLNSTATSGNYLDIGNGTTATLANAMKGITVDLDGITLNGKALTGIEVLMPASYTAGTEYGVYVSGDGTTVALCSDDATALTVGGTVTTGLSIGTSTTAISIGDCVKGIEVGTFGSPVTVQNSDWDTAGGAYTITKVMVSGCLNEDLSDSQCVRQLWSRFKITASQTAGSGKDYYGGEMQVRPHTGSAAIELAGGTYAGVWNYWENSDSAHALTVSGGYHYGSINMVEMCSTGVISGGTFAAANMTNHVDTDPAAATFDAILINKVSGAYDWKNGIEFTDCMSGAVFKVADDQTICSDDNQSILVDISGTANAGFMKVDVAGAARYIALYAIKTS